MYESLFIVGCLDHLYTAGPQGRLNQLAQCPMSEEANKSLDGHLMNQDYHLKTMDSNLFETFWN